MEERKYSPELLQAIAEKQTIVNERGLDILVKPVPDDSRPGAVDPRTYAGARKMFTGIKGFIVRRFMKKLIDANDPEGSAKRIRNMMSGVKSIPITSGVETECATVQANDVDVPIRIYTPKVKASTLVPVFYYIHGGGFLAGRPEVVEEMCKLMVQNTGCVSVQVDYRLAPEHLFPAAVDDCYAVLQWVHANAAQFGGDAEKIIISGDSAGGNLATVCAMLDRDAGTNMVKAQALIYPTVNAAGVEDEEYKFSLDEYTILSEHRRVAEGMIGLLQGNSFCELMGIKDAKDVRISPYLADLTGMPPTIILYAEFDFLRVECEAYARKLKKAGVPVKAVRYSGMDHGFADRTGVTPQAEDCMIEIGNYMKEFFA